MSAKVIPFPSKLRSLSAGLPPPPAREIPYWARAAFKMLAKNVRAGLCRPDRLFVCYVQDDTIHYLNLGFDPVELDRAVAAAADHMDDTISR